GKTELAMRAAFKVVEFGKQVAVLAPTTVLAEQHYRTFGERMADYPFIIECLSRFRSPRRQREIIAAVKKGQVDILVGTHRILSKDVGFADLGLVIVDEEQRFGVEQKERLKHLRTTVEVLTLTATPIPRTLHMAMVGLRDISSLATPPLDRRAIATRVCTWSDELIREAIIRELNRDGQVYFVHNRVHSIQGIARKIADLVPEARLVVGHGQMSGDELEEVMLGFVRHQADVLVCTTIIEAGLDIPNVNTIFIDRADMFGLADLHQLRGRVGRYKHRAYCYLLLNADRPLTSIAAKRLKAIEEYSELGAGFRIAMRDLEIRGAGNILGPQQSGHIAAVGYEMYCQLLEKSVKRMRNEPYTERPGVHLELDVEAYIPKSYIPSDRQRMECYRRFAGCRTPEDLELLVGDLRDAFGNYPETVETLLTLTEIKVRAGQWKIKTIIKKEPDVVFGIDGEVKKLEPLFAGGSGSVRVPDGRTLHWRLPDHYFHGKTLLGALVNLLRRESTKIDPPRGAARADRKVPAGTGKPS
ncbi:MAG: TRCF domain-containing protein, partial [Dehalococcoidia bacterium]